MITVAEINDIDQLDNFRLAWHSLLGKTKGATFAHSPEWLEHYWEHFGQGLKLRVLLFTLGNKVIGIVPLVVKPVSTKLGIMRVLTYPLDGWGAFYGQIGSNPAATMVTAMRHLHTSKRDWDLIDLRYIDQDGHDNKRTANALKSVGFQGSEAIWKQLPIVNTLDTNWTSYLASRSAETQHTIETAERVISARGPVAFYRSQMEDPTSPDWNPRWDLWAKFEQMDFRFGNETTIAGGHFSNQKKLAFLREIHGPAVRAGRARIEALFINNSLVACAYGLLHATGIDYLAIGRRGGAPNESVTHLIARMIQKSIHDKEHSLNLSLLGTELAQMWKNEDRKSYRCSHFPVMAPLSQLLRINRWINKPPQQQKSPQIAIIKKPALNMAPKTNQDPTIEITNEAPQDWSADNNSRPKGDRPGFRIVG